MIPFICFLAIFVNYSNQEFLPNDGYHAVDNCMSRDGRGIIGLRPDTAQNDCRRIHYCRTTGPPTDLNKFPVQPFTFHCPDKDAPYYNARTCSCVATDDHCEENKRYLDRCVRYYEYEEAEETCQSYLNASIYYMNNIPRFGVPNEYWSCAPANHVHGMRSQAYRFNCAQVDLVFDIESCECRRPDEIVSPEFNYNPMKRYSCAEVIHGTPRGEAE